MADLRERLDISGHVYYCRAVGPSLLHKGNDLDDIISGLERCVCLVPVLDKTVFDEDHTVTRAMFWFFIGYMRARMEQSIVPFIPQTEPSERLDLSGTPLQGIDIMFDADTFMEKIPAKFASKLLCYNYYENPTTNLYASRRINYRCLRLRFNIYEQAFQNARMYYNDSTGFDRTDSEFESYLESNLNCGCRVASFGAEHKLEPQMMVYRDEVHPYVADYPKFMAGRKTFRRLTEKERSETGVRIELITDVLIPVHKLLGAYIKCYLACPDADCPVFVLAALFEPDFAGGRTSGYDWDSFEDTEFWNEIYPYGTFIDTRRSRMYFPIGLMADGELMAADEKLHVGKNLDYVFPQ